MFSKILYFRLSRKEFMKEFVYPSVDDIIEFNALMLSIIRVKKADQHKVLSVGKIAECIAEAEDCEGDLYDKAAVLMFMLVKNHPFASGNRRTAFITTKEFVLKNKGKFKIPNNSSNARVMIGIRERYYSNDKIKEWIKNGKIRKFER